MGRRKKLGKVLGWAGLESSLSLIPQRALEHEWHTALFHLEVRRSGFSTPVSVITRGTALRVLVLACMCMCGNL